jgi:hypothetical protein
MNSVIFNTMSLVLAMVGITLIWIPGAWGWFGAALCAVAVLIGVRGTTDRRCPGGAVGMDIAGSFIAGFALPWGLAFQIKHADGGLDDLLIQLPLTTLLTVSGASALIFWVAQIVGRFKFRALFVVVAAAAVISFTVFGTSAWTFADRQYGEQESAASPSGPSDHLAQKS